MRLHRFEVQGLAGLEDQPRRGRPPTYSREQVGAIGATALTDPQTRQLPFQSWTLDRLVAYLSEHKDITMQRSRLNEVLLREGLRWRRRKQESWCGERVDPDVAQKKGALEALYVCPPAGSIVVCLLWCASRGVPLVVCLSWCASRGVPRRDGSRSRQESPRVAKSRQELARRAPGRIVTEPTPAPTPRPAGRARQEIDYGRREQGYVFGAFCPATGAAFTVPYPRRTIVNWVGFLEQVDAWLPAEPIRVYAILDNLSTHRAVDVLLFVLTHPRWEFAFQPTYAAYLNLIEPWWKVLRSLALKGRRFETWADVCQAVEAATSYWNAHQHPFIWGRRRRHRPRRPSAIALQPSVA